MRQPLFLLVIYIFLNSGSLSLCRAAEDEKQTCIRAEGDESIAACSNFIKSAGLAGRSLAAVYYNRGTAYLRKNDIARAIADFDKSLEILPDFAQPHINRGNAYREQGDIDRAIEDFREAARLAPTIAEPHISLGALLDLKGKTDQAIIEFREAIHLEPLNAAPHNSLGLALREKNNNKEAIAEFREAIRLDPKFSYAYNELGTTLDEEGNTKEAIEKYNQSIQIDPNFAPPHFNLALAHLQKADAASWPQKTVELQEACKEFQVIIRLEPNNELYAKIFEKFNATLSADKHAPCKPS